MTKKERLYREWIAIRNQLKDQSPIDVEKMCDRYKYNDYKIYELEHNIEMANAALHAQEIRIKTEAYYATPEGQEFKSNLEELIEKNHKEYRALHDEFQDWIISEMNSMCPGGWTARLSLGWKSGNVEIGLVNRDPERNFPMQFGHEFTIYFDSYAFGKKSPRFELNYGTLGSFDLFNDETRPLYLNGLATISNNKEWLQLLMAKFIEYTQKANKLSEEVDEMNKKLKNPNI